ncbi:sugar nucleotide-binding protein [Candidatus Peregrinibacteria bacterium]|nr:sugar nucleotide-binding protein [Candidatus Peregrinibacteria bacterium]
MKKVLLLGATGFIGSHFKCSLPGAGFKVFTPRIEIRNHTEVEKAAYETKPDIIINATGITGYPNVDWCEEHPGETMSVNVAGSINIAAVAEEFGTYMVQMASGCVYDGDKKGGFKEDDEPNYFGSLYSRSRVLSEKTLKDFKNVLQLRVRIPITGKPHPKNLINKLLKYPKMINIKNSCTVIEDFIPAAIELMKRKETGIFNMTNIGAMDHKAIMTMYKEIVDPKFEIKLMGKKEQDVLCKRRANCVLNTDKREKLGVHMPPLEESLRRVLEKYKKVMVEE